jgi:N-acetyl-gamma-glutamyl-phosphate reductase
MPYQLTGHVHEQEISYQLGRDVAFHPHVAPFFRGLSVTIRAGFKAPVEAEALMGRWRQVYADSPLIEVVADVPEIRQVAGSARAMLGGVSVDARDRRCASFVVVLDNLLKGAASQAMQNINVSLGLDELFGLN